MASITTRETSAVSGDRTGITNVNTPLTNAQIDQNFIELNNDKLEETDAVSTNTANKVVKRDGSGNFAMGDLTATNIQLTSATPTIYFNGTSDGGPGINSDMAIKATPEGLDFYEPEDGDKIHMQILDDSGVDIKYGLLINGTDTIDSNRNTDINSLGVGVAASGVAGEGRFTNCVTTYYSSDIRLKENITNIPNAMDKLLQLNGVEYDWTDEHIQAHGGEDGYFMRKHDIGLIAQEVEAVLPEIVAENNEGYKAIKYERVVALLVEAVKELNKEVKELRSKQL
jgi:hypothetical protein